MPSEQRDLKGNDIWRLLCIQYKNKPDDFRVTIGHQTRRIPEEPISIYNLPEIQGVMSVELGEVRKWAATAEVIHVAEATTNE